MGSPAAGFRLREARSDDGPGLEALARLTAFPLDVADELGRAVSDLWVATAAGLDAPLAYLLCWNVADEVQVQHVATEPHTRRRGAAHALVANAIDRARARGARLMVLEVRASNVGAQALYQRFGFVPVRRRQGYYAAGADSSREDAIEMQMELDVATTPTEAWGHRSMRRRVNDVHDTEPSRRSGLTVPLLRRESIGDAYHVLTFEAPRAIKARAGQFLMVRGAEWGDAPLLGRPMSYLSAGSTPSILIKVIGEGTRRMAQAKPGERYDLLGPLGNGWTPPTAGRRPVLVGGGVGIAPLLFLARVMSRESRPLAIYGGRTDRDLPLHEDLSALCDVQVTTEDGSRGTRGRVTDVLESRLTKDAQVYTCGPDRMMARVAELCARAGVPCEASLETPMACGYGVCLGCPVRMLDGEYRYTCVAGPCLDAHTIDWATEAGPTRKAAPA